MRALAYSRSLASLRQFTVTYEDFGPNDLLFDRFISEFVGHMPVGPGLLTRDIRGRATIYCLSENGRIGEIARFFHVLAEMAVNHRHKDGEVTRELLQATTDALIERAGVRSPYAQKSVLF